MIEEILWLIRMDENNIIISTNTKMSIKIYASNNRIIIKESFARFACGDVFYHYSIISCIDFNRHFCIGRNYCIIFIYSYNS